MKKTVKYLVWSLALAMAVAMFTGCAKAPTQELNDAQAAISAAAAAGATKYAVEQLKTVNDGIAAANAAIKEQEGKFFKNYDKAKEVLAKTKADADALKASIPARKEAAKNAATAAQNEAVAAVDGAKKLLAKAPKGKGTSSDLAAFKADLTGLDSALAEVSALITSEDFFPAADKANQVKAKAGEISAQIEAAMAKVAPKKAAAPAKK
jgi:hypothetical protein